MMPLRCSRRNLRCSPRLERIVTMAGDDVKYDRAALEEMEQGLSHVVSHLQVVQDRILTASNMMMQGVFLGLAGDFLAAALAEQFAKSIGNLAHKYVDVMRDLDAAIGDMEQADRRAAEHFK